jgi:DNA-binding NarL/FixJ family response regulator
MVDCEAAGVGCDWQRRADVRMSRAAPADGTRVLIVDDHDLFRTGLRALLDEEGFDVAAAASGAAALRRVGELRPDVVVMDLNMPAMSGIETTSRLLDIRPDASVLILTIASDDRRVIEAVRAGARGYLLKDAPLEEIVAGIRAAAAGQSIIAPGIAGALIEHVRDSKVAAPRDSIPAAPQLSRREGEVLELLGAGCDNREIAQRLFLSQSTVKNHVSRLLGKLGAENRVQAAVYAIRYGLINGQDTSSS